MKLGRNWAWVLWGGATLSLTAGTWIESGFGNGLIVLGVCIAFPAFITALKD